MIEKLNIGIVLEKITFENEHIVKILTESGNLIFLKAKGLDSFKSKNRLALNIFNTVEVEYFTSSFSKVNSGRLKRAIAIKEFNSINEKTLNIIEASRNLILDSDNLNKLTYKILKKIIYCLEINNFKFQNILELMINVLRLNGYFFVVDKCCICGTRKEINGFSLDVGGLICVKHKESFKYFLSGETLRKIIEINLLKDPSLSKDLEFSPDEELKIKSMYKQFLEQTLGMNLFVIDRI